MTFTSLHMLKIQFYSLSCDMTVFFTLFKIWFVDLYLIDLEEPSILNICDMSCKFFFLRLLSFFWLRWVFVAVRGLFLIAACVGLL